MLNKSKINELSQALRKNYVPIIFGSNNLYIRYLSVAICSIIESSHKENYYDIFILYTDIDKNNQELIKSQFLGLKNFSCHFINISERISKFKLGKKMHITKETFYRFFIIDIFKNLNKVIYLDCDLVVNDDIANLFKIDISNFYLGACRDLIGIGVSHAPYGFIRKRQYNILHLDDFHNYFNAGVLLMNLFEIRKKITSSDMLKKAESTKFPWLDQDVLNVLCQKKVYILNDGWNMTCHYTHRRGIKHAPKKMYLNWDESSKKPSIIHFTGPNNIKPWFNPFDYPAEYFWKYAHKSPFYQTIVDDMLNRTIFKIRKKRKLKKINRYIADCKTIN